ncbi:MAG: alpha/beta hydrolase [Burkholderiaceae bacterium]|nr:alpha/beta hydrolase [Burkholderiaceae bacterium]
MTSIQGLTMALALSLAAPAMAQSALTPCRVDGLKNEALCGQLNRALDPARPQGTHVTVHYLVVPALARRKLPDPVFLLAGGPGQSAITLAGQLMPLLGRLGNRRDLVFVDQRGTGRSAPLICDDVRHQPLAQSLDGAAQEIRMQQCREALMKLPHGDLRQYTTTIAMQDLDAVRERLGAEQINLVGASYGTRAALEYLRQFPQHVRRVILDGVAPPDMVLPASFSTDSQAALEQMFDACEAEADCRQRHPRLRQDWTALLAGLPKTVTLNHPLTGQPERLTLTRDAVLGAVRGPLYVPGYASALPQAIADARQGRFEGLAGLSGLLGSGRAARLSMGMHFSVVCAEDVPRLDRARDAGGKDFGAQFAEAYTRICKDWPRGPVSAEFYQVKPSPVPVLLLSGGSDPATPPRHGERVAKALGAKALHVIVPNAGHGVMGLGCARDLVFRFISAAEDKDALALDAGCVSRIPRPPAFQPVQIGSEARP